MEARGRCPQPSVPVPRGAEEPCACSTWSHCLLLSGCGVLGCAPAPQAALQLRLFAKVYIKPSGANATSSSHRPHQGAGRVSCPRASRGAGPVLRRKNQSYRSQFSLLVPGHPSLSAKAAGCTPLAPGPRPPSNHFQLPGVFALK